MKKLFTLLPVAIFFAIACSVIDQYVWNNDFSWINAAIGFVIGGLMVLLSDENGAKHRREV